MTIYIIAECPVCGYWTKPMLGDDHALHCVNCVRQKKKSEGKTAFYGHTITVDDLQKAPLMKMFEVVKKPKQSPFKRKLKAIT